METFSALLANCARNSPVNAEFSTQRPGTMSFDVFFDLRKNKRLSKTLWGWRFETESNCNELFLSMDLTHKSHNSSVLYPRMHAPDEHSKQKWAHLCYEWCTVGHGIGALCVLCDWSTSLRRSALCSLFHQVMISYRCIILMYKSDLWLLKV